MNKEDFDSFQASFDHIDDILKVLADELNQQLRDHHMGYDAFWGDLRVCVNSDTSQEDRDLLVELFITDALSVSVQRAMGKAYSDPWARIKGFMALRQTPEEVQSPIAASEYEEIKTIAIEAERQKPINLESIPVNMQRPEWTEAEQFELLMKKEKDEFV